MPGYWVFEWLQHTSFSTAIRESTLLFPLVEGTHVLALAISVGIVVLLDIRLLGWGLTKTPVSDVFETLRPSALVGFTLMFATGILLFISEPLVCVTTRSFLLKIVLLGLAGVNALVFDRSVYPSLASKPAAAIMPGRGKLAGAASLVLWIAIIALRRWTAYA